MLAAASGMNIVSGSYTHALTAMQNKTVRSLRHTVGQSN